VDVQDWGNVPVGLAELRTSRAVVTCPLRKPIGSEVAAVMPVSGLEFIALQKHPHPVDVLRDGYRGSLRHNGRTLIKSSSCTSSLHDELRDPFIRLALRLMTTGHQVRLAFLNRSKTDRDQDLGDGCRRIPGPHFLTTDFARVEILEDADWP